MRILQFTTYSLNKLDHGGKIRSQEIKKALKKKHEIETLSIEWGDLDLVDGYEVTISKSYMHSLGLNELFQDWAICLCVAENLEIKNKIYNIIRQYNPEIVLFEQPYLFNIFENYVKTERIIHNARIVYSSYNIEHIMKYEIYKIHMPPDIASEAADIVRQLEVEVIKKAEYAIVVCEEEAIFVKSINNDCVVTVRNNGNGFITQKLMKQNLKISDASEHYIFVGSAHPPNIEGLLKIIQKLEKQTTASEFALKIIGSVGLERVIIDATERCINSNILILGIIDFDQLRGEIEISKGILLPIFSGGGTNLKTAEALLSEKYIIGTSKSFRGYEKFKNEEGIKIIDDIDEMIFHMTNFKPKSTYKRSDAIASLTWDNILKNIDLELESILKS